MAALTKISKNEVRDTLGRGAFGVVYRCWDPGLDRIVAVKVLLAAEHASQELLDRFANEAKTAARLSHPHIVQVYDAGLESGKPFLVMEFVEGKTLDAMVGELGPELLPVLQLIYHLSDALAYSHERGIIHRDIKPSNIIVDPRGRPKLMDFGLARLADEARWLSATGDLIGTPRYMSPEQALMPSEDVDARTDIYSLGAIFYELLSGKPLVDGPTPLAVLKQLTDSSSVPITHWRPDLPPRCTEICHRMIAKDRDQRFANAHEVTDAFKRLIVDCVIEAPEIRSLAIDPLNTTALVQRELPTADTKVVAQQTHRASGNPWVWGLSLLVVIAFVLLGWLFANREWLGIDKDETEALMATQNEETGLPMEEWQRRYDSLAETRDDRQYHTQLNELREELNLAIRRLPMQGELRTLRGKVLMRNGDFRAALDDWDSARMEDEDLSIARLRLHAMAMWEKLHLGSISEGALTPIRFDKLIPWIETCENIQTDPHETARSKAMAYWIHLAIGEGDFDPELEPSMPMVPREDPAFADMQTWRSLVFLEHADQLHYIDDSSPESERRTARLERDRWDQKAVQALREGLEYDAHHLGLLFLRTYRWSRRLEWDTTDGIAWADAERRHKPAFETAFLRYRVAPARLGFESAMGRAILLNQIGDHARALDQVSEFIDRGNAPADAIAFWSWLQINHPTNDQIDAALASSLLKMTDAAVEGGSEAFGVYMIRGICQSALGQVDEAKREISDGKKACRIEDWEDVSGSFGEWLQASDQSLLVFTDQTIDVIWRFAIPESVRSKLQLDLIQDLAAEANSPTPSISEDDRRSLLAAGYFRMAKMAAERDDRQGVLNYTKLCLALQSPSVTIEFFQQDEMLQAWNGDAEYRSLLDQLPQEDR